MRDLNEIKKYLNEAQKIVFDNEGDFIWAFCDGDVMCLMGIYFSFNTVKVYYIMESGQHVVTDINIDIFIDWMRGIND